MALLPLEPADADSAAAMLAHAGRQGQSVQLHGRRTKLRAFANDDTVVPMSTAGLTGGFAHYAGDLVATIPAGWTLQAANDALRQERQWLPLDPPFAGAATIGGIVAANDSGPRRQRYGNPRDLVIGMEVALTNGTIARSGGRVVKNVAGYDLSRLFCGSRGTLGLITSVTFKLSPLAPASRTVVARFASLAQAADAALALSTHASLTPSTLELATRDHRLLVRYETTTGVSDRMAATTAGILASRGADATALSGDDEAQVWREHQGDECDVNGLVIRVSVLPTASGAALDDVARLATEFAVEWHGTGRPALGVLRICAAGEAEGVRRFSAALHVAIAVRGGHMQCEGDLNLLDAELEPLGDPGSAAAVGFAVKQRFDAAGVLPWLWGRS